MRVPDGAIHSPTQVRWHLAVLLLVSLLLALAGVVASGSEHQGSAEFHSTIEWVGSLFGLVTGLMLVVRFYSLGHYAHLFIGLAFFVNGGEDLVHGLLSMAEVQSWVGGPASSIAQFIPATYVTGRLLLGILLLVSPRVPEWIGESRNAKRETLWISVLVLIGSMIVTAGAFQVPLPTFIYPDRVISRPVDFLSAVLLLAALFSFVRWYRRSRDMLVWWVALSIAVNVVGQILMSMSKGLYDPFFDVAHVYKVFGYVIPMFGLSFYQLATLTAHQQAVRALRRSETRQRLALSGAELGTWDWNVLTGEVVFDRRWAEMLGYTLDEIGPDVRAWEQLVHPDDLPDVQAAQEAHLQGRTEHYEREHRARTKSGAWVWVLDRGRVLTRDADGRPERLTGTRHDVTARKEAEAELKRVRDQEVLVSASIQEMFLRGRPPTHLDQVQIEYLAVPSQAVDGDFADFFTYRRPVLDVVVGDVMGKGVPAALMGAATKLQFARTLGVLRSGPDNRLPDPAAVLQGVHRRVSQRLMSLDSFATVCYARFDWERRRLTFVDCGHPGILHLSAGDGSSRILKGSNFPLGFLDDVRYEEVHESFEPGDLFLLYSDGLIEARRADGEMFGVKRVQEVVEALEHADPPAVVTALKRTLAQYVGTDELNDDLTLVAIQIQSLPKTRLRPPLERTEDFRRHVVELRRMREVIAAFSVEALGERADERFVNDLQLAVQEVFTNIIDHVPVAEEESPITLELVGFADRVSLRVSYEGPAFHPVSVDLPSATDRSESGRGLFIISQMVDTLRYVGTGAGGSRVEMNKFPADFPFSVS